MKKLLYLIIALVASTGCSKDGDGFNLDISQKELSFSAEGSEQIVNIASDVNWNCEYSADWLLVRQQQDRIRVIVDDNTSSEERFDMIKITVNGSVQDEIRVTQAGTEITIENSSVNVNSKGETITVAIESNVNWSYDHQIEWCDVKKSGSNLIFDVPRNYNMQDRSGTVIVKFGDVSKSVAITQYGCEWYDSFEMVDVAGGTFYMGAQNSSSSGKNYDLSAYQIEAPVHQVTLNSFSIGKFEVTQAQWQAAMGSNPAGNKGSDLPVENVTWVQVQEFIALLNSASGQNYRLPTEAEWEFAAKGGNQSDDYKYSGSSVLGACGWYYSNSESKTHEVGSKEANELGIFDMSGNVREWCSDWFGYYDSSSVSNPQGPSSGSMKVNRGGSWTTPVINCRNSYRHTDDPYDSAIDLGFRLVLVK